MKPRFLSTQNIIDMEVYNHNDKHIGEVKDVMIDIMYGRIAYAVLAFGGFMGLGEDLFAIPWEAFSVDSHNDRLLLEVKKEALEKAEGFDEDEKPDASDIQFLKKTYEYYDVKPYWIQ